MSLTPTLLCRLLDAGGQGRSVHVSLLSVGQRNGLAKNYLGERDPRSCVDFEQRALAGRLVQKAVTSRVLGSVCAAQVWLV
jgi:hypothetical protein